MNRFVKKSLLVLLLIPTISFAKYQITTNIINHGDATATHRVDYDSINHDFNGITYYYEIEYDNNTRPRKVMLKGIKQLDCSLNRYRYLTYTTFIFENGHLINKTTDQATLWQPNKPELQYEYNMICKGK